MSERDHVAEATADLLALSDVKRWTVVKATRGQSVAEHSFNVLVIATELLRRLGLVDNQTYAGMFAWAMIHDMPETLTGDINGKFKRDYPAMRAAVVEAEEKAFPRYAGVAAHVPEHIKAIVKVADKVEAIVFIHTWGAGPRAESVNVELRHHLFDDSIPRLAAALVGVPNTGQHMVESLKLMVGDMVRRITSEEHSIQMRPK